MILFIDGETRVEVTKSHSQVTQQEVTPCLEICLLCHQWIKAWSYVLIIYLTLPTDLASRSKYPCFIK